MVSGRKKSRASAPEALLWRTDVPWPQDNEPVMSLLADVDVPKVLARLKALGVATTGKGKNALEEALAQPDVVTRITQPARGATALALALVAQHPAGMEKDHLEFELGLLLEADAHTAQAGVESLAELGVVLLVGGRRSERYRLLPPIRVETALATAGWLDALERRGGSPGSGERLGMPIKTTPLHVLALVTAVLAAQPPRLRSAALGTELHARDGAKVLEALHHVMDRSLIQQMVSLAVRAGLARPSGPRLSASLEALTVLSQPAEQFWTELLPRAFTVRAFGGILRMLREPDAGFVAETTLRRALKVLVHTEQVLSGHPFPTDGRGNEAGARTELDILRASPLFERGRTPEGQPALRLHPSIHAALRGAEPQSSDQRSDGHVGIDHEVHVGPSTPPHLLAGLGFMAVPQMLDTVSRFTLAPTSVANAAARGLEPHQMQAILEELSPRGVPDNVLHTLKDYGTTRGRALMARGLVVMFSGTAEADRVLSDPDAASLLGDPVAPCVYLVDPSREMQARQKLKDLGLAVGEDTLMYAPRTEEAEEALEDAPLGTRLAQQRREGLAGALHEFGRLDPVALRAPPANVLAALSGQPASRLTPAGGEVVPLRAKKPAAAASVAVVGQGVASVLERARLDGHEVALHYTPEAGGGHETMTVEILEVFERASTVMVRVRFPRNPRAADRVLRISRVQSAELVTGKKRAPS